MISHRSVAVTLKGVSQIMLQADPRTGGLFVLGVAIHSPIFALMMLFGSAIGTAAGTVLDKDEARVTNGLYGFNAALVALASFVFFRPTIPVVVAAAFFAILSSALMRAMLRTPVPPFTAPFVVCGWLLYLAGSSLGFDPAMHIGSDSNFLHGLLAGVGQILFQDSAISGGLFLAGLAVSSRRAAGAAFFGSAFGACMGVVLAQPMAPIASGLFGYNSALTAIALERQHYAKMFIGITLSVVVLILLGRYEFPVLTAPFVLATWVALRINGPQS